MNKKISLFIFLTFCVVSSESGEVCGNKYCFTNNGKNLTCPKGTWLLEIPDKEAWSSFEDLILTKNNIKLNLKVDEDINWKWNSGSDIQTSTKIFTVFNDDRIIFGCLKNNSFQGEYYNTKISMICQICSDSEDSSCFEIIEIDTTWYDALKYCIAQNKKLAEFFDDKVPKELTKNLDPFKCYWIGMSKIRLIWPHYNKTIQFSKWFYGYPINPEKLNRCFKIVNSNTLYWIETNCNEDLDVVCMRELNEKNKKINSKSTSTISDSGPLGFNTLYTVSSRETVSQDKIFDDLQAKNIAIGVGFFLVFVLIFLLIFILVYFLCKQKKSSEPKSFKEKSNETTVDYYAKDYLYESNELSSESPIAEPYYYSQVGEKNETRKTVYPNYYNSKKEEEEEYSEVEVSGN